MCSRNSNSHSTRNIININARLGTESNLLIAQFILLLGKPTVKYRYGVSPDHPEVKNVITQFTNLLRDPRCGFYGNVSVGTDVTLDQLLSNYSAVVLAYGADADRSLGVQGEDSRGFLSARRFVGWYNGLPEDVNLEVDLSSHTAVIIGHG